MSIYEAGKFTFDQNLKQKTVNLNNTYQNQIVIKVTPVGENINLYLTDVQNNYFIIEKNTFEEVVVNYIVLESDL